jgi:hypothetical protein
MKPQLCSVGLHFWHPLARARPRIAVSIPPGMTWGCFTQRYVNDRGGSTAFVRDDTTPQAGCSVHLMALQRPQIAPVTFLPPKISPCSQEQSTSVSVGTSAPQKTYSETGSQNRGDESSINGGFPGFAR